MVYDKCTSMSLTQCTSLMEVESRVSLYMNQYIYDMIDCKDAIKTT